MSSLPDMRNERATNASMPCDSTANVFSMASVYCPLRAMSPSFARPAASAFAFQSRGPAIRPATVTALELGDAISKPPAVSSTFTVSGSLVRLSIKPEITTSSPTTKKRGACKRAINGLLVRVVVEAMPKRASVAATRAVAFQRVNESGYLTASEA